MVMLVPEATVREAATSPRRGGHESLRACHLAARDGGARYARSTRTARCSASATTCDVNPAFRAADLVDLEPLDERRRSRPRYGRMSVRVLMR
jgi:hypothetical protein